MPMSYFRVAYLTGKKNVPGFSSYHHLNQAITPLDIHPNPHLGLVCI